MTSSRGSQVESHLANRHVQTDKAGSSCWENLNHNILVSIMSALRMHDLINGASRACSSWQAAAKDPDCWSSIFHVDKSELLDEIAEWGTLDDFWLILCCIFGDHSWKNKGIVLREKDIAHDVYEVG